MTSTRSPERAGSAAHEPHHTRAGAPRTPEARAPRQPDRTEPREPDDLPRAPGLGETQRRLLLVLKRRGPSTVGELAGALDLARETLRQHLNGLAGRGLVRRAGARREGPGRPEILYALAESADALFPQAEGALLRDLARHLVERDQADLLRSFLERRLERRRRQAAARLGGLRGRARLEEVAAILSEDGFMARVEPDDAGGEPLLRLCHCPIRDLVAASRLPCEVEVAFVRELVGEPLERVEYMPEGDRTCAYRRRDATADATGAPDAAASTT